MDVLGSVKNRLKTMAIINRNKKLKLAKQTKPVSLKKQIVYKNEENNIKKNIIISSATIKYARKRQINNQPVFTLKKIKAGIKNVLIEKSKEREVIPKKESYQEKKLEEKKIVKENQEDITQKSKEILEKNIILRFKIFVGNSKKEIKSLKKEIEKEENYLKKIKTEKELEVHRKKIKVLQEKINKLKGLYDNLLSQYEFLGFDEINDSILASYIDDFKFKNSIDDIDDLVIKCKNEVTYLEEINLLILNVDRLKLKEKKVKDRTNFLNLDYDHRLIDLNKLMDKEKIVDRYIKKSEEYLVLLEKEINDNTLVSNKTTRLKFNRDYINNLFRLNIGLSLFDKTIIGAFIGAFLIKKSLSPLLLQAFKREEVIKYSFKYHEYVKKITDNLSLVHETCLLLKDSLTDVSYIRRYMESEYKEYLQVKAYQELYQKLIKLEKNLNGKYEKTLKVEKKLLEQKKKSHEKQKKLENTLLNSQ